MPSWAVDAVGRKARTAANKAELVIANHAHERAAAHGGAERARVAASAISRSARPPCLLHRHHMLCKVQAEEAEIGFSELTPLSLIADSP